MGRSRARKRKPQPRPPDSELGRRLVNGARIDIGDMVLTAQGHSPAYAEEVAAAKDALATQFPEEAGFDPFENLRVADQEIDALVQEVDDWIRVGNHVRLVTQVDRTMVGIDGELTMRTAHRLRIDDAPPDWARRTARIISDLRSHLDRVIFELAQRAASQPLTETEMRNLSFPVDEPARHQTMERLRRKLPHLAEKTLVVILEAQPTRMPAGTDPRTSWIYMLNWLNNIQKHRTMNVTAVGNVTQRGPRSRIFGEGEILIAAEDIFGNPCDDGCHYDGMVLYGQRGASQFKHDDGTIEPLTPLCRFLREAFVLVVGLTCHLLETEGVVDEWFRCEDPSCKQCRDAELQDQERLARAR